MIRIKNCLAAKIKKFANRFLLNSIIEVYLGKLGASITVFSNNKAVETLFLTHDNVNQIHNIDAFRQLLDKYPGYHSVMLVDLPTLKLRQEFLIAIDTGIKKNPVDRYIRQNFEDNYIISYNVLDIIHTNSEIWKTQIASIKITCIIKTFIDIIIMHPNVSFEGCYLLPLEFPQIIYLILSNQNTRISDSVEYVNTYLSNKAMEHNHTAIALNDNVNDIDKHNYENKIILTVSITQASGIIFFLFDHQNVIYHTTVPYCQNKSPEYTYGILKHETHEIISSFNLYILESNKDVIIHYIVDSKIQQLIENEQNNSSARSIIITNIHNIYADIVLSRLFMLCTKREAYNKYLYNLNKLSKINSIFLKPILILLLFLTCNLCAMQYKVSVQKNKLSDKYYQIATIHNKQRMIEHSLISKNVKHSDIEKYYLEYYLQSKKYPLRLQDIDIIYNNPSVQIKSVKYSASGQFNSTELRIDLYYIIQQNIDAEELYAQVDGFQKNVTKIFKLYKVEFHRPMLQQNFFIPPNTTKLLMSLSVTTPDYSND